MCVKVSCHPPWLGISFGRSLWGVSTHPPPFGRKAVRQGYPAFGQWSFPIVSGQLLDGRALCRQLRVFQLPRSILHHGHHPPLGWAAWSLWGCCAAPPFWQESSPPRLTGLWPLVFFCCMRPAPSWQGLMPTVWSCPWRKRLPHKKIKNSTSSFFLVFTATTFCLFSFYRK